MSPKFCFTRISRNVNGLENKSWTQNIPRKIFYKVALLKSGSIILIRLKVSLKAMEFRHFHGNGAHLKIIVVFQKIVSTINFRRKIS